MAINVGFIGLGAMGKGMATNLLKNGFGLTVLGHVRPEPVAELVRLGAGEARSARELAASVEVVFSMVRDDAQTEAVMWGADGVLAGVKAGATIIVCSTVSPAICQRLAQDAVHTGVGVLDAPVSGARMAANAGTLTVMVGGDEALFRRMEPLLKAIGTNIFYLGGLGMGAVAKLANNMLAVTNIVATTEAMSFAVKAGIPTETFRSFVSVSSGSNWVAQHWELFAELKKQEGPAAQLHEGYKDVSLALSCARELGVDTPFISNLLQQDVFRQVPDTSTSPQSKQVVLPRASSMSSTTSSASTPIPPALPNRSSSKMAAGRRPSSSMSCRRR